MSGWGTALRIARRDAIKQRGRSLLVATLIALPVLAGVAGDVLIRSGEQTPIESVQSQLADADAWILAPAGVGAVTQSWYFGDGQPTVGSVVADDASAGGTGNADGAGDGEPVNVADLPARPASAVLPLLPAGARITAWQHIDSVPVRAPSGTYVSAAADLLDIDAAAAGGRYRVLSGTAPAGSGQIALTSHLAHRLDVGVGATIMAGAPQRRYAVTALLAAAATGGSRIPLGDFDAVVALPGDLQHVGQPWDDDGTRYLVTSPVPITLAMIDRLNAEGVAAYSRSVALDPADRARLNPPSSSPLLIGGLAIGIVMAIMQVIFLAGPAFAIGARRMRRQFGLLVATGARPSQLRAVVLGTGLVLGMAGSLAGLALGIGAGAVLRQAFRAWLGLHSTGLHLRPLELAGVAALGVVTAVLAALIPAITAGRASPLSLLGRQPPSSRPVRWWSLAGAVLAAAGVALTVWMAVRPLPTGAGGPAVRDRGMGLAAGAVLVEVGLLLAVPLILKVAARLGARLPTTGRLALRDASRHRGRTTPAIAAVTVCATAAVVLGVLLASAGEGARSRYVAGIPTGDVQVQFSPPGFGTAPELPSNVTAAAQAAVRAQWPHATAIPYSAIDAQSIPQGGRGLLIPEQNLCPYDEPAGNITSDLPTAGTLDTEIITPPAFQYATPTPAEQAAAATDWRCYGRSYSRLTAGQAHVHRQVGGTISNTGVPTVVVAGPDLLRQLTGITDPAADAALAAGGAVVLDRSYLSPDGTLSTAVLASSDDGPQPGPDDGATPTAPSPLKVTDIRSVPAVLGRWTPIPLGVVLSPQAARQLGWTTSPGGLVVDPGQRVTRDQTDAVGLAVQAATGSYAQASLEPGALTGAGDDDRAPLTALLIVIALLAAGTVIVVTALGLADSRPDLATLSAIGAPPGLRRLVTGWTAGLVTLVGCLLGGAIGLVPAWGLLRLIQVIQGSVADPIVVPWAVLVPLLIVIPLVAFAIGTLLPRSKLPMVARVE